MEGQKVLRVLFVEDSPEDVELCLHELRRAGFDPIAERVETAQEFLAMLKDKTWDIVLADYTMPQFNGMEALKILQELGQEIPFIVVTGSISEETAVECILQGADNYILKENMLRLGSAVSAALEKWELKRQHQKAEEALRKSEQKYRELVEQSPDGIFSVDLEGRFLSANRALCDQLGYSREELLSMSVWDVVPPTQQSIYKERLEKIMTGESLNTPAEYEVQSKTGKRYVVEVRSVPLFKEGKIVGFQSIARDITQRKQAEEDLRQSLEKLQKTIEGTVSAMASVVEIKDPYTAGHQKRVTRLASAIAEELGLPKEQIEGIRIAGLIHDIGKVSIPAEILSKPGRITDLEFSVIKTHSQAGYDILKTIEFPWPIAQIVLQHHERLNGSGYPQGLSGEEILLEARILGVADVVEAMASHRPYRPALGIDKALEEIAQNRGILYDARVAEACLKLFADKGFTLE